MIVDFCVVSFVLIFHHFSPKYCSHHEVVDDLTANAGFFNI